MSKANLKSHSKTAIEQSATKITQPEEDFEKWATEPDFIYGGPFVKQEKPSALLGTATPINMQLQGTFKKSFAYYSLKERMPVILTKVIDYCSREGMQIKAKYGANDDELRNFIAYVSKLKNDLITNKKYDKFTVDTPEAKKWNEWISACENSYYFTNTWVFTECYVYRRLREACELQKGLQNFDPFDEQKEKAFHTSLEPMCIAAEKVATMLPESEKDKRKADLITLLKLSLWANKCDLSLSLGEQVTLGASSAPEGKAPPPEAKTTPPGAKAPPPDAKAPPPAASESVVAQTVIDPLQMILDFKDKVLVDDSGKAADGIMAKAEAMAKAIEGEPPALPSKTAVAAPAPPAAEPPAAPEGEAPPEEPKIPCPAKMVIPQYVMFDIVCDNAGYELFADLCLAHFLVAQNIVQKVRFHVKKIPWFVSDVTPRDFNYVISSCRTAAYSREVPAEPKPEPKADAKPAEATPAEGGEAPPPTAEEPPPPRRIDAGPLRALAEQWQKYVDDGTFIVMSDDFWTSPHVYKDMKKYDYPLYRKLQYAIGVLFKGDLNYRKLLGERNCNPMLGFEPALQGFIPAPIIALRTVKADLICGLPKGKADQLNKLDEQWMQKGDYGVIQYCGKAEALKVSDRPCMDYGVTCFSTVCPVHKDM